MQYKTFESITLFIVKAIVAICFLAGLVIFLFIAYFYVNRFYHIFTFEPYYKNLYQNSQKTDCDYHYIKFMNDRQIILSENNVCPAEHKESFAPKLFCSKGTTYNKGGEKWCESKLVDLNTF